MSREYVKAKQVMVKASDTIDEDIILQDYLNTAIRDLKKASSYTWGEPITGNRPITPDMHGQALLVTADARLELPKWSDLEEGWWLEFVPEDSFDDSRYKTYIDLYQGGTVEEPVVGGEPDETITVTYPADEIRGLFEYIKGDAILVRSAVPNQFIVIGNAKYVTKDELIEIRDIALNLKWWEHWYPHFFPDVADKIAAAEVVINNPYADGPEIYAAYGALAVVVNRLGKRITFPCPYEFINGDEDGNNTLTSVDDIIHAGHIDSIRMVITEAETGGIITARQPKYALDTITSVIADPSITPVEYLQGEQVFSQFNEWSRNGSTNIGFEFLSDTAEECDVTVVMRGEVDCIESSVHTKYILTASISTEYDTVASKLESICKISADKYVSGLLIGTDSKEIRTEEAYVAGRNETTGAGTPERPYIYTYHKNPFAFGFYYNQNNNKVTFLTQNGTIEMDDFDTSNVSTGKFSTAFSKIDAFGLWQISANRTGFVRDTGQYVRDSLDINIDYTRAVHKWVLDFPETTKIDCASRLWRPDIFDAEEVSVITQTESIAVDNENYTVLLLNFKDPIINSDAEEVSVVTQTETSMSGSTFISKLLNPQPEVSLSDHETITTTQSTTTMSAEAYITKLS